MSVNDYGREEQARRKTIDMREKISRQAEEYFKKTKQDFRKTKKESSNQFLSEHLGRNTIKGVPFQYQLGHQHLSENKGSTSPDQDGFMMKTNYKSKDSFFADNSKFQLANEGKKLKDRKNPYAMSSILDVKRFNQTIDFKKSLPRKPLIGHSENTVGRYSRAYKVNWASIEKRQDLNCIQFERVPGRDFTVKPYQPRSTDGYYEVLENVAYNESVERQKEYANKAGMTLSKFAKTASGLRSTNLSKENIASGTRKGIGFGKSIPVQNSASSSALPSFMQKGNSYSRFAVEILNPDSIERNEIQASDQTPVLPKIDSKNYIKSCDESFDEFFGKP